MTQSIKRAIALTWQQHRDSLALRPAVLSTIPNITDTLEHTGGLDDLRTAEEGNTVEEGNIVSEEKDTTDTGTDTLSHAQDDAVAVDYASDSFSSASHDSTTPWEMLHSQLPPDPEPFIMDDSINV